MGEPANPTQVHLVPRFTWYPGSPGTQVHLVPRFTWKNGRWVGECVCECRSVHVNVFWLIKNVLWLSSFVQVTVVGWMNEFVFASSYCEGAVCPSYACLYSSVLRMLCSSSLQKCLRIVSGESEGFGQGIVLGQSPWRWACQWGSVCRAEEKLCVKS